MKVKVVGNRDERDSYCKKFCSVYEEFKDRILEVDVVEPTDDGFFDYQLASYYFKIRYSGRNICKKCCKIIGNCLMATE